MLPRVPAPASPVRSVRFSPEKSRYKVNLEMLAHPKTTQRCEHNFPRCVKST